MRHSRAITAMLLGTTLLAASLVGCGSGGTSGGSDSTYEKVNLSMAVNGIDTQIDSLVSNHFAQLVAKRSEGNIVIDVFPNDTLAGGNSTKGVEYIAVGGSDLRAYATSVLANLEPKISVATLPWSFNRPGTSSTPLAANTTPSCWRPRASPIWVPSTTASAS